MRSDTALTHIESQIMPPVVVEGYRPLRIPASARVVFAARVPLARQLAQRVVGEGLVEDPGVADRQELPRLALRDPAAEAAVAIGLGDDDVDLVLQRAHRQAPVVPLRLVKLAQRPTTFELFVAGASSGTGASAEGALILSSTGVSVIGFGAGFGIGRLIGRTEIDGTTVDSLVSDQLALIILAFGKERGRGKSKRKSKKTKEQKSKRFFHHPISFHLKTLRHSESSLTNLIKRFARARITER